MSGVSTAYGNYAGKSATDRGTAIVKPGQDMDKNAFLKILAAELANLDPTGNNDSTQYVTQMAQFSTMEQMQNLNNTLYSTSSYSLVGKGVTLGVYDESGNPYTGIVKGVSVKNGEATVSVEVNINGVNQYKDFSINDILTVLDTSDTSLGIMGNINGNMSFISATSFIGKNVELSEKDEDGNTYSGKVLGVIKDNGVIKLRVEIGEGDNKEIKEFTYDKVVKVEEVKEDSDVESDSTEEV